MSPFTTPDELREALASGEALSVADSMRHFGTDDVQGVALLALEAALVAHTFHIIGEPQLLDRNELLEHGMYAADLLAALILTQPEWLAAQARAHLSWPRYQANNGRLKWLAEVTAEHIARRHPVTSEELDTPATPSVSS